MSAVTITLSSQGHIVIPKEIRDELHWQAGTQLSLVSSPSGITLKATPQKRGGNLGDLIGMLKYDGPPVATETLCKPVDYGNAWEKKGE
jgi:AbrB family looped-hinge helix DNA binding protein